MASSSSISPNVPNPPDQPKPTTPAAERILIIRLGAMGDVVRTLPAAAAIRAEYPGAHLAWLVEPAAAGAVEASGIVDETIVFPRRDLVESLRLADGLTFAGQLAGFLRHLRQRHFDLTLDFHGLLKSGLLAWISGAPTRVGYGRRAAREGAHLFANRHIELTTTAMSRFDRNAALVSELWPEAVLPTHSLLAPSALAIARLAARLRVSDRDRATGFVLVHPGSSPGADHKRYPPEAWAEVARGLAAQGIEVWVVHGPHRAERRLVEGMVEASGGSMVFAPEPRSFDDLLALMARASVFVSSDSGPLHAASLSGVPAVQLVGPTDPVQNEPWRESPSRRVRVALPCSPCRRGCADAACMRSIPPGWVVEAVVDLRRTVGEGQPEGRTRQAESSR